MTRKWIWLGGFAAGYLANSAAAQGYGGPNDFAGHMMGYGFGFVGMGMMVLVWGAIIALAVYVFRQVTAGDAPKKDGAALDILKERLAKGEIDPEDYAVRAKILGQ